MYCGFDCVYPFNIVDYLSSVGKEFAFFAVFSVFFFSFLSTKRIKSANFHSIAHWMRARPMTAAECRIPPDVNLTHTARKFQREIAKITGHNWIWKLLYLFVLWMHALSNSVHPILDLSKLVNVRSAPLRTFHAFIFSRNNSHSICVMHTRISISSIELASPDLWGSLYFIPLHLYFICRAVEIRAWILWFTLILFCYSPAPNLSQKKKKSFIFVFFFCIAKLFGVRCVVVFNSFNFIQTHSLIFISIFTHCLFHNSP